MLKVFRASALGVLPWRKTLLASLLCAAVLPLLAARAFGDAPTVYYGGVIYGKAGAAPIEAVVVKDGRFSYAGGLEGALKAAGKGCKRVDLKGRMMLPSFFDAHAHPDFGALLDLRDFSYAKAVPTPEEYVAHIREYLKAHPGMRSLRGTGWDNAAFAEGPPDKALLDAVSAEIPIFIRSSDQHSAWVNSKMLELSKITRDSPDPAGGKIEHDKNGEPGGTVRDMASLTVEAALPPRSVEENKELILKFQDMAHRLGITGYMCAMVLPRGNLYTAYRELLAEGKLLTYTRLAFMMTPDTYADTIKWASSEAAAYEKSGASELLGFKLAKFFMDGTILGQSAYLLEDYAARPGYRGEPQWPADLVALREAFSLCEKNGLRIHIHAVGDGAVHLALDGLEVIKVPNRHAITHLELVDPADFARFRAMGVIATINPYWFCKSVVWADSELKQLGTERAEHMLPAKSFYDAGVRVAAASDYPVSSLPNPLAGIEMAATRTLIAPWRSGRSAEDCTENPAEAITVSQALDAFTLSAAYAYDLERVTGSIEAGKSADFILLDKNIFKTTPSEAKVLETWFKGKQVYRAE